MKCKVLFLFFFSCLAISLCGQNLVPNPSFEEYTECPLSVAGLGPVAESWYSWNETPDYFNACSNDIGGNAGTPNNTWGFQWPITGVAYASLAT